jgi:hypothetical protein
VCARAKQKPQTFLRAAHPAQAKLPAQMAVMAAEPVVMEEVMAMAMAVLKVAFL